MRLSQIGGSFNSKAARFACGRLGEYFVGGNGGGNTSPADGHGTRIAA